MRGTLSMRKLALFAGGLLVGFLLVTPGGAHVNNDFSHLFKRHIRPALDYGKVKKTVTVPPGDNRFMQVECPGKKRVVGGGVDATDGSPEPVGHYLGQRVIESYPMRNNRGWAAHVVDEEGVGSEATVYAICARV